MEVRELEGHYLRLKTMVEVFLLRLDRLMLQKRDPGDLIRDVHGLTVELGDIMHALERPVASELSSMTLTRRPSTANLMSKSRTDPTEDRENCTSMQLELCRKAVEVEELKLHYDWEIQRMERNHAQEVQSLRDALSRGNSIIDRWEKLNLTGARVRK